MTVDSFKFLPRLIAAYYEMTEVQTELPVPWTPLTRRLSECKFGLITSGGLYYKPEQEPFNLEREQAEPTWGDPSFRAIPVDAAQEDVGVSHLHVNTHPAEADFNILLPIHRFRELAAEGRIGGLASKAYSFMGFQGFPPDTRAWRETYGPQVAEALKAEAVDCVLLTPS